MAQDDTLMAAMQREWDEIGFAIWKTRAWRMIRRRYIVSNRLSGKRATLSDNFLMDLEIHRRRTPNLRSALASMAREIRSTRSAV